MPLNHGGWRNFFTRSNWKQIQWINISISFTKINVILYTWIYFLVQGWNVMPNTSQCQCQQLASCCSYHHSVLIQKKPYAHNHCAAALSHLPDWSQSWFNACCQNVKTNIQYPVISNPMHTESFIYVIYIRVQRTMYYSQHW